MIEIAMGFIYLTHEMEIEMEELEQKPHCGSFSRPDPSWCPSFGQCVECSICDQMEFDLVSHLKRQAIFSLKVFGPGPRIKGITDHIRKELTEVEADPSGLEWIDIVILALDGAWRAGYTPEEIAAAIEAKQIENENRSWPDWHDYEQDQPIEHIRGRGRKDTAKSEHVQALDFHHTASHIHIAVIDSKTGVIITEAAPNMVLVQAVINFLQRAWRSGAPAALAVDGSSVFKTKNFRSFVEGEGVKLRCLFPGDRELRWKLESTFFPRVAV